MKNAFNLLVFSIPFLWLNAQEEGSLKGSELFGNISARQIGPALMSGRIGDIEGHPSNNRVLYIGAAGGGVWKSTNGGASFSPIFDDYCQSIGVVKIDPNDPNNTLWVGTGEIWTRNSVTVGNGLYKSNDAGSTWKKMGFDLSERISSIQINPSNANEIYVGVLGALWGDSPERGVYKSNDGGNTWSKILYINERTGCSDVVMDPSNPNILYASLWEFRRTAWNFDSGGPNSALYKSTDGGKTWNKIHNGFPKENLGRIAIAIAPSNSNILYAVIESVENRGLYRSDDGGANWKHLNDDFGLVVRPFYFSRIVIDPKNPDVILKAGLFGSISRDGGKTFKNFGNMHPDIHDFWIDINDSDRMYVATDGGLYRTWDGGETMDMVDNLPLSQFYHISADNEDPYNVYGGLQDNGSWFGPSRSPGGVEARDWTNVGFGDGFRVLKHPSKPYVYSEMQGAENVWRYDIKMDKTSSIQPLRAEGQDKLRFNWNAPIALSPNKPERLYIGSQYLHKSEDEGTTWTLISPDLTTNDKAKQPEESGGISADNSGAENHCTIFTIAESPFDENIIWVGTDDGNLQLTQDGGKNWTNLTPNIPGLPQNSWVYHIEASVHNRNTAYAVFDRHTMNDMKPYIYKTSDMGKSWVSISTADIPIFARNLQEDLVNQDLLYLGTELGLYISLDGGKSWSQFKNNVPPVAIHYLAMQPKTNDLVLGTHGRGVIILDDLSALRQITPEIAEEELFFVKTEPTVMLENSNFGGGSTELQFVGPNPSTNARITYYMKKRHTFGKMTMEVFDQSGKKVADLSPGKSKGLNVVDWNYSYKLPKIASGASFTFGAFNAPRVPAGTYRVVITKGNSSYDTSLILKYDPKSVLTQAERDAKHKIEMDLYSMNQDLAYMVYKLENTVNFLQKAIDNGQINQKQGDKAIVSLNSLKDVLVITKGDNYVGAGEPQLREKISELYGKVVSSFDKVSSSDLETKKLLEKDLKEGTNKFNYINEKEVAKLLDAAVKKGAQPLNFVGFDEFLEMK